MSDIFHPAVLCHIFMSRIFISYIFSAPIIVTSADRHFITPAIKSMLRRKNCLMRAGQAKEAGALTELVRAAVILQNLLLL